jgi:hypothetical protein
VPAGGCFEVVKRATKSWKLRRLRRRKLFDEGDRGRLVWLVDLGVISTPCNRRQGRAKQRRAAGQESRIKSRELNQESGIRE